ncbi:phage tail tape measure protein, TP901 family, core region [Pseudomonas cuatrocienegasensis]|uniref:Phage tail tape measure protein, TP901 family, core region n=1 Tax=Pseudomonas cuatrocienegasensis TaxID=543360 RepID=A0ABY1BQZ4_9PSED|nr:MULTISPECIES: phage tail tape measure protein [Pseudomonas]OEC32889.1 phage tail tape measure protein [Pseudomonas sp. 21C1]SER41544.1 phage tail tape measure protein, TP901 family, core region [Pseudomonas cuatrocienegasensis]
MAESKYSLRLAAVDAFSKTFGDFSKQADELQEGVKQQRAELDKLNRTARDADGFAKLGEKVEKTTTALQAARVEQSRLGREHEQAAAKVERLGQEYGQATAATKALEGSTDATNAQIRAARIEQKRLGQELNSATAEVKKLDTAQDRNTASVRTLEGAQRAERNELTRLQAALTGAGVDTGKLASEQKRLEAATEQANAALQAQRARLDAVRTAQGKVDGNRGARADLRGQMVETAAIGYLASRPVNQAMELETAMADVAKVVQFEEGQREAMASANLKMASDRLISAAGITAVDLAQIQYAAGQSGIGNDAKDSAGKQAAIVEFTRDAAIMGAAFDMDAKSSGETMAGWQASMNLDRAGTLDLADATNHLGNSFNATPADIASVVKRYGAVGQASGLSPEQTAALSAAFLNPGTEKEIAGTGFKNFTAALTKGKAATKGQRETWEELGFDPEELALGMQQDAPKTIMSVLEALKAAPEEEQSALATQLFGSESIGAIMPLLQNLGEVDRAFGMVANKADAAGSMMKEAAGVADTSRAGWNGFTAKLTRLSTLVGNAMLPALNAVLVPLGAVVDGLSWAAETFPNVTAAIAVAAGGLAALKVGALGLKFAGLLVGQAFNKAGLARAKLDATTGRTAMGADAAVARLNRTMARLGAAGGIGGAGRRGRGRRAGRGGLGTGAGALGGVAARGGAGRGAGGKLGMLGKGAGALALGIGAMEVASLVSEGASGKEIGGSVGSTAGGMGGMWAGAAAGAMIGSVVPIVGTAIGGIIGGALGGLAGSSLGEWVGEGAGSLFDGDKAAAGPEAKPAAAIAAAAVAPKVPLLLAPATNKAVLAAPGAPLAGAPDRLAAPGDTAKDVVNSVADNRQIHFAPVFQISGADKATAEALANDVLGKVKASFMPLMMANPLAVRRGASLTDGSD